MNAVVEVDVGTAGLAEEGLVSRGRTAIGMTGRVVGCVGLGLGDEAANAVNGECAADQLTSDGKHVASEELGGQQCPGRVVGRIRLQAQR